VLAIVEEHGHIVEACVTESRRRMVAEGNSTTSPVADFTRTRGHRRPGGGGRIAFRERPG